jgi:hypothetical protein
VETASARSLTAEIDETLGATRRASACATRLASPAPSGSGAKMTIVVWPVYISMWLNSPCSNCAAGILRLPVRDSDVTGRRAFGDADLPDPYELKLRLHSGEL